MGYSSRPSDMPSIGFGSPLKLQSSLFVTSRRPSIPLSPTLLPLISFSSYRDGMGGTPTSLATCTGRHRLIHQLPVEILCDIFTYSNLDSVADECGTKVTISHVCRRWRTIVLCMPLLWSTICVVNPTSTTPDRVATFFRRSASCLVDLTIKEALRPSPAQWAIVEDLWTVIQPFHWRLRAIELDLNGHAETIISRSSGSCFSGLEVLNLQLRNHSKDLAGDLMSVFKTGSRLTHLTWKGLESPIGLYHNTLTHLKLTGIFSVDATYQILLHCPLLIDLDVGRLEAGHVSPPASVIALHGLRSLTIYTHDSTDSLFNVLEAPGLRRVQLHHRLAPTAPRSQGAFGRFLDRSGCRLEDFIFWDKTISEDTFVDYLRLAGLQSLHELHIQQPSVTDTILLSLSPLPDGSTLMPELRVMTIMACSSSDGTLGNLLNSRIPRCGRASSEHRLVVGLHGVHELDRNMIKDLRRRGMYVKINGET
ncbi:hypothetical protein AB1N83_013335 [Pleurotus pulmonarius]